MKSIKWDGTAITKPGIYTGVPIEKYHSQDVCDGPSISSSGLRAIVLKSPAHFYATWDGNKQREPEKPARHFIIGRAVHHLILGEPGFAKLFAVQPDDYEDEKTGEIKNWNNNAGACKRWHEARQKEKRLVLTSSEVMNIRGMAMTLSKNPIVRAGALNGLIERSIFWKDKETGVWLKARPDSIPNHSGDFVDLKTTESVLYPRLVYAIGEYAYHAQGALVCRGAREVLGIERPTFSLVFVEKTMPWCDYVVTIKEDALKQGAKMNRVALDTFARCLEAERWPGPGNERSDAQPIELSDRAKQAIDDKLTLMEA